MDKKEIKKILRQRLFLGYGQMKDKALDESEVRQRAGQIFEIIKEDKGFEISSSDQDELAGELVNDLLGWGPLQKFADDPYVTEIMVNGPYKIYIEKSGRKTLADVQFDDENHLRYIVERMIRPTGRRVDESYPYVDFSLPDGSRVNVILPPLSVGGATVTIRKFLKQIEKIEDLAGMGTLNNNMAVFLKACVKAKVNIVFSGATGVGKTTTLEVLSSYIDSSERIITIEDALELHLRQGHVVRLLTRSPNIEGKGEITIKELFINTLRMRPTRIILGEIRGAEALDFLQSLNSGHSGALAVIHASSPEDVINRLETMVLYSGTNLSEWIIRKQISHGLDLVVQQNQLVDGSRKITRISEVAEGEERSMCRDLFVFEQEGIDSSGRVLGRFKSTGIKPKFMDKFFKRGVSLSEDIFKEG